MGKDLEASDPGHSRYCLAICIEGLRKTARNMSVRKASVPEEIRTEYLPNKNLERHR
jgi:hypothetical protein